MKWQHWYKIALWITAILILILIPVFNTNLYQIGVMTLIMVNVLLAASLWLILTTGQVTLGHASFATIGGYMSAGMVTAYGLNSWLSLPIAIITTGLVALIIGYVTLRIKGVYFVLATLALGEFIKIVFGMWEHPFGGLGGLLNLPPPDPIVIPGLIKIQFITNVELYYLILVLVLIGILILYRLYTGPIGRVFRSIKQADELAESVGINIMRYKVLAFVVACMLAGLAGVLFTYSVRYISPRVLSLPQSIYYLLCVAVGGEASVVGPVLGAIALGVFAEVTRPVKEFVPIIFGLLLIASRLFFKSGLWGIIQKIWRLFVVIPKNRMISEHAGNYLGS
jgi:branched-chain amino acid transport system permease protein